MLGSSPRVQWREPARDRRTPIVSRALPVAHSFFVDLALKRNDAGGQNGGAHWDAFVADLARVRALDGRFEKQTIP